MANNRNLKIRGRRRQRKSLCKSEFAFFQSSFQLLQVTNFVKRRWTLLKLNSYEPYPSSEIERKFCRRLCTSSVKVEIRHFHVVVACVADALNLLYGLDECLGRLQLRRSRAVTAKKCTKKCHARAKLLFWLLNLLLFLTSSLLSPSSDLKVPNTLRGRFILLQLMKATLPYFPPNMKR